MLVLVAVAHGEHRDPRDLAAAGGLRVLDEGAPGLRPAAPAATDEVEAPGHPAAPPVTGGSADHGKTIQRSVSFHDQSGTKTVCGLV